MRTHSTACNGIAVTVIITGAVLAIRVPALSNDIITSNFNSVVKLGICRWGIFEEGDPSVAIDESDTQICWCVVANWLRPIAPPASIGLFDTQVVKVVLSRCWLVAPVIVVTAVWACELGNGIGFSLERNGLALRAYLDVRIEPAPTYFEYLPG